MTVQFSLWQGAVGNFQWGLPPRGVLAAAWVLGPGSVGPVGVWDFPVCRDGLWPGSYSELCQAIAVLARAHQDAIWRRTTAHQQLRSLLREFYPTFLAVFTSRFTLGIASPDARAVLAIAPTAAAAAKL
jgi:hypothetical protein